MDYFLTVEDEILMLPVQNTSREIPVELSCGDGFHRELIARSAETAVDSWICVPLPSGLAGEELRLHWEGEYRFAAAAHFLNSTWFSIRYGDHIRSGIHFFYPVLHNFRIEAVRKKQKNLLIQCKNTLKNNGNSFTIRAANRILFHPELVCDSAGEICPSAPADSLVSGDAEDSRIVCFENGSRIFSVCRNSLGQNYLAFPCYLDSDGSVHPDPQIEQLRIWERAWSELLDGEVIPLRFAYRPGLWPNIRLTEADNTAEDVTACAFEVFVAITGSEGSVTLRLPWSTVRIDLSGHEIRCGNNVLHDIGPDAVHSVRILSDAVSTDLFCGGKLLISAAEEQAEQKQAVENVSGNLELCSVDQPYRPEISVEKFGDLRVDIKVYGLHGLDYSVDAQTALPSAETDEAEKPLYACDQFSVFRTRVEDSCYDLAEARLLSDRALISLPRVPEEFEWRKTLWGDMSRVINRCDIWTCDAAVGKYPQLDTDCTVLGAAYRIALETFLKCSDPLYALPGQDHMWSAGLFQGKGEGFGVWIRDTAHIAIRSGNLLDRETARRTLNYTLRRGFDNGSDGPAMAIVGIWDYYLASGDLSEPAEHFAELIQNVQVIDTRFDESRGLVRAEQSTSNDAFPEPENGGFSLGSECYYMQAYHAMAEFGKLLGADEVQISRWNTRAETIRENIREQYWNPVFGFYTSGPAGSEAFRRGCWESSGTEAVIWDKFSIAPASQRDSVLEKLYKKAMSPYGIILFPDRPEHNHFVGPVWPVWQAGFAAAAAAAKNTELLRQLLFQQIRNALLHKTFHEVLESDSGKSWRWPGQLWHAAGFVSLVFYGLFGISYSACGLTFAPCIPEEFRGIRLCGLQYGNAHLTVETEGSGTSFDMFLDGVPCGIIPTDIIGEHFIRLVSCIPESLR